MQKINVKNLLRLNKQKKCRPLHLILANRAQEKLGEIDNVFSVNYHTQLNGGDELTFTVYKEVNGKPCRLWEELIQFRLIWVKEYKEWFQMTVQIDESEKITKKVINAVSLCEAELSQVYMNSTEINTEADIARKEYQHPTIFYNPDAVNESLLHRVLEKVPNYTIKEVDKTLHNIQRSFCIDDSTTVYDFLTGTLAPEIGCLFLFDSNERGIYVYDLETTCLGTKSDGTPCNYRSDTDFTVCPECGGTQLHFPYGFDTTIFVDKNNLGKDIQLSVNTDEIKNCFKVTGGDDIVNAAVKNINPNGSNTIYYFNESTRQDMSDELVRKLDCYQALLTEYTTTKEFSISNTAQYNSLIDKIKQCYPDTNYAKLNAAYTGYHNLIAQYYNTIDLLLYLESGMMPKPNDTDNTTAQSQANLLTAASLSSVAVTDVAVPNLIYTANNAVLAMAKCIINTGSFQVKISESSINSQTWTGKFEVTSYFDKEDTATTDFITILINDEEEIYIQQKIDKTMAKYGDTLVTDLFQIKEAAEFEKELKKYCLNSLNSFSEAYHSALDVLTEHKQSEEDASFYEQLYVPYYEKFKMIQQEITTRGSDIETVSNIKTNLETIKSEVHDTLNLENYLGTELWNTFISYRREDSYQNDNYVSDGLSNEELINLCNELMQTAKTQLIKSGEKQYSITATLNNLLLIKDEDGNCVFEPILNDFTLGNFIRCKIDGVLYKMRLSDVTINYEDLNQLSVTFYDVNTLKSLMHTASTILQSAASMASSYSAVKKQAQKGANADYSIDTLRKEGLDSAQFHIFNTYNKTIIDDHGILSRNYDDVNDQYSDEQLRINGSNLILTDNAWKSTRLAIGKQTYTLNNASHTEYGVNSDFVLSGKIIGGDIYSANYQTDANGNIIRGTHFGLSSGNFELADGRILYNKEANTVTLKNVTMQWNTINNLSISDITGLDDKFNSLQEQIDGSITTWFQNGEPALDNYPANEWTTDADRTIHLGDLYYDNLTGYAYRFQYTDNRFSWAKITDTDITKALSDAAKAQDTADGKRRVFVTTPVPPYDEGDLWTQGAEGDLLRCAVPKAKGENYHVNDWVKTSKYTDDTTANEAKQLLADYQSAINAAFGVTATYIDKNTVISPKIGGGYLKISNGSQSVQIDSASGTLFKVLNGTTNVMGIDSSGNGYFQGKITATTGSIGGCELNHGHIFYNSPLQPDGKYYGFGLNGTMDNYDTEGAIAFYAGSSDALPSSVMNTAPLRIYHNGALYASKAVISGILTADSGSRIADFYIDSDKLYRNEGIYGVGLSAPSNANIAIWAGTNTSQIGNAPFQVYYDGSIKAEKGHIGGWEIAEDEFVSLKGNTVMSRLSPHQLWVSENGNGDNYSHILPTSIFTHSVSRDGNHNYVFHAKMEEGTLTLYDANSPEDVVFVIDLATKTIGIGEGWTTPWD